MALDIRPTSRLPGSAATGPVPTAHAVSPPGAPPGPRRGWPQRGAWLAPAVLGALLLLLWEALTRLGGVSPFVLPAPEDVAGAFWGALLDGSLLGNAAATLLESLVGFVIGALVAVPLGYVVARNRWLAWAIQPYLAASQALPAVALAPLLVIWLGFGLPPTAALCALIVFFPATITTTLGLRALDRETLDAARVDGASHWTLARYIELPLALPAILAGLRASLTLSITGAVVGEFVTGGTGLGLGSLLEIASSRLETPLVFATLVALALLAALLYGLARLIERRFSYLEDH